MKKILVFVILIITIVGCEKDHVVPKELADVDNMCYTHPKEALKKLEELRNKLSDYSEYARNRFLLTQIKVRDVNYISHTDDRVIKELVDYFNDNGSLTERITAYHYLGSTYRDLRDYPKAIGAYEKVIDLSKSMTTRADTMVCLRTCGQLWHIHMLQRNVEEVVKAAKKELELAESIKVATPDIYMDVASAFWQTGQKDSVEKYYAIARQMVDSEKDNESGSVVSILSEQLSFYSKFRNKEKALLCKSMIDKCRNINPPKNYYVALGHFFRYFESPDSAIMCYKKSYEFRDGTYGNQGATRALMEIYAERKEWETSYFYAKKYIETSDSIETQLKNEESEAIINQSKYNRDMQEEVELIKKMDRQKWITGIIVVVVAVCSMWMILWYYLSRKGRKKAISEKEHLLEECKRKIDVMQAVIEEKEQAIRLNIEKEEKRRNNDECRKEIREKEFAQSYENLIVEINKSIKNNEVLTLMKRNHVTAYINQVYPGFIEELGTSNMQRIMVHCLNKLSIKDSDIPALVGMSRTTIWRILRKEKGNSQDAT